MSSPASPRSILLAVPAVGSVYPIPDPPVNYFPYAFLVYLAVGIVWIVSYYRRKPAAIAVAREDLDRTHDLYVAEVPMPKSAQPIADLTPGHGRRVLPGGCRPVPSRQAWRRAGVSPVEERKWLRRRPPSRSASTSLD